MMELLAPAGGMESLCAAVRYGADAVYLGLDALNARRGAQNFTPESLLEASRICKAAGVQIHLTLNTLLFGTELKQAADCLRAACEAGVEAVIVQDLAVARTVRECAPKLKLHASTQMAVHNLAGVREAAALGFSRVVLARELTLAEIAAICRESPVEIEVFCHGALCMSMSGRCLLSAMAGGRSGNRGMCAQPCRMPYSIGGREESPLSLRDLSLLTPEWMARLEEAGVASVKIEGRMKRPEYVAASVTAAREAMSGRMPDAELLSAVFSRSGFTDGYLTGQRTRAMFGVRTKEDALASSAAVRRIASGGAPLPQADGSPLPFTPWEPPAYAKHPGRKKPRLRLALARAEQWTPELAGAAERIALYPDELPRLPQGALESGKLIVREPPASFDEGALRASLERVWEAGVRELLALSLGGLRIGREMGFALHGDTALGVTNSLALEEYANLGLRDCAVSVEVAAAKFGHLGGRLPRGVAAYGKLPLMVLRNCPVKAHLGCAKCRAGGGALTDRQKRRFPVSCAGGTAQLYNSDALWLADKLGEFRGLDFAWLYFTDEPARRVTEALSLFASAAPPPEGLRFTRGLAFRKVI